VAIFLVMFHYIMCMEPSFSKLYRHERAWVISNEDGDDDTKDDQDNAL
jgi:hypothetical protein